MGVENVDTPLDADIKDLTILPGAARCCALANLGMQRMALTGFGGDPGRCWNRQRVCECHPSIGIGWIRIPMVAHAIRAADDVQETDCDDVIPGDRQAAIKQRSCAGTVALGCELIVFIVRAIAREYFGHAVPVGLIAYRPRAVYVGKGFRASCLNWALPIASGGLKGIPHIKSAGCLPGPEYMQIIIVVGVDRYAAVHRPAC